MMTAALPASNYLDCLDPRPRRARRTRYRLPPPNLPASHACGSCPDHDLGGRLPTVITIDGRALLVLRAYDCPDVRHHDSQRLHEAVVMYEVQDMKTGLRHSRWLLSPAVSSPKGALP